MANSQPAEQSSRLQRGGIANIAVSLLVAAASVAAVLAGTHILQVRAASSAGARATAPIAVDTATFQRQTGYDVARRFVGRMEPNRETILAFERAGTVQSVLADEGQSIAAGQVIAELDTALLQARLQELKAQRREFDAQLGLARLTAERRATLKSRGWTAEQNFDEARFDVARLEAAIERVDAAVAAIRINEDKSILRAPFAGTIAARLIDDGAIVSAGTPVAQILESGPGKIRVGVAQDAAERLTVGSSYEFSAGTSDLSAKLVSVRPDLDPRTRTVTAIFETGKPLTLAYGSVVTLRFTDTIKEPGGWVPLTALSEGHKGIWSLMTVADDAAGRVIRREAVEILHVADDEAYIRGALTTGTRYIRSGTNRVTPGQRVALLRDH